MTDQENDYYILCIGGMPKGEDEASVKFANT
jgi:hypothetical protein